MCHIELWRSGATRWITSLSVMSPQRKACHIDFATVKVNKYAKVHMAVIVKGQQKSDIKICITHGLKIILFAQGHVGDVLHIFALPINCALLCACFLHHRTLLCPPTEAAIYWLKI